jgi:hypothetical protein
MVSELHLIERPKPLGPRLSASLRRDDSALDVRVEAHVSRPWAARERALRRHRKLPPPWAAMRSLNKT